MSSGAKRIFPIALFKVSGEAAAGDATESASPNAEAMPTHRRMWQRFNRLTALPPDVTWV
jgi:hypothetical protein